MKSTISLLSIILIQTFTFSQSLSLYDAIQYAMKNNKTIMYAAEQNYLASNSQLNSAYAVYNPTLNFQTSFMRSFNRTQYSAPLTGVQLYQYNKYQQFNPYLNLRETFLTPFGSKLTLTGGLQTIASGITSLSYQSSPTLGFTFQQPLSLSGIKAGHINKKIAEQTYQEAGITFKLQKEQLALSVIQNYFQFWLAEQSVEQSERDKESTQHILNIADVKLKHGSIPGFEELNLRVQYNLAEDNLLQARNNLKTQRITFLRILGASLDSTISFDQSIKIDSINFSLSYAIKKAMENRLEIKQSKISLAEDKLRLSQTSSTMSPSLQINASYNSNSDFNQNFIQSFNMPNYGWNIQGTLIVPILDGGLTSSQVEIAQRNLDVKKEDISLLKENIIIDIETQYRTLKLDIKRIGSLRFSLKAASEALDIAELRFNSGQITSTEIENIRDRYNAARNTLDGAKISYMFERANLAKAMGELFQWINSLKTIKKE